MNTQATGKCDRCGSTDLKRLISKVAILRPAFDASKFEKRELLDGVDYGNPASMAQFFKRMGETFQDEQNDVMDEIVGRLEHGEDVAQTLGIEGHDHAAHAAGEAGDAGGSEAE